MGRVQLALTVKDVERSVAFYERLFGVPANKVKPGYANFAIEDPPLKLVLLEGDGERLNHLGVEVGTREEVAAATARLDEQGLPTLTEQGVCCYAEQDKVWVTDPDGAEWEVYTVIADAEQMEASSKACC